MKSEGRVTMSCTVSLLQFEKWALITPRAGAMAAPAITVRREMESIVAVSFPDGFCFILITVLFHLETYSSAKLQSAADKDTRVPKREKCAANLEKIWI